MISCDCCNVAYIFAADGIQQNNRVTTFFGDHAPEVVDRLFEWQLRQYVRQRCVEALLHAPFNVKLMIKQLP